MGKRFPASFFNKLFHFYVENVLFHTAFEFYRKAIRSVSLNIVFEKSNHFSHWMPSFKASFVSVYPLSIPTICATPGKTIEVPCWSLLSHLFNGCLTGRVCLGWYYIRLNFTNSWHLKMRSSHKEPIAESCAQKTSTMYTNQSRQNREYWKPLSNFRASIESA